MEQHGDCDSVFPHQGYDDGHALVFYAPTGLDEISFHIGQGYDGEVNKRSGDALNVEDQLKLIHQFCQNPHLKHLRVDSEFLEFSTYSNITIHAHLIWMTLMRELQGSTSLEYLEFWYFPDSFEDELNWMRPMIEMLSTNSSLVGLKMGIPNAGDISIVRFMKVVLSHQTLQLLNLAFKDGDSTIEAFKLLVASLTKDSTGYQSNTRLRAIFMNTMLDNYYVNKKFIMNTMPGKHIVNKEHKPLIEAFINMLETNKTLTTIQIPDFVILAEDIVKVLYALEVNQSIRNIILGGDLGGLDCSTTVRYEEFSREEVFSRLLKLIKFRNDHGNGLSTVDVQGTGLENPKYDVHIQGALKKKYCNDNDGSHGELFVRPMSCRVFLCGFPEEKQLYERK